MKIKSLTSLFLCVFSISFANVDLNYINQVKNRFIEANQQYNTFKIHDKLEIHKAMVATTFTKPGDLILDVGSHIGEYSLFYKNLVGNSGLVISYEASPYIFEYFKNRLKSLKVPNILIKNKAVSSINNKKILMKVYKEIGPACCTVEPDLMYEERMPGNTEMVEIETEKLDDLLKIDNLPILTFIKIDVEGHEHAVIDGARETLLLNRPLVIFEYGFITGLFEPQTIKQMEDLGYECYDLENNQRVYPGYTKSLTDLLAIPKERVQEIMNLLPYLYL
jgi:FkbM family methyltransferase